LPQAFHYATNILLLANHTVAAFGPPESLCAHPAIEAAMGVSVAKDHGDGLYQYKLEKIR
jgi:ABC-type cobalamin/Fe3+-siderophores transport system ATPase subunit